MIRLLLLICAGVVMSKTGAHARDWQAQKPPFTVLAQGSTFGTSADWPLRFKRHQFGVACFSTATCSVRYHGHNHGAELRTPTKPDAVEHARRMTGSFGDIRNFSRGPVLNWQPLSGGQLNAEIDLAAIFAGELIRHNTRRDEIPDGISMGLTHIIVEIDDRTVSVYTRTMIPLKEPSIPGNRFSYFRDDLIKVYSKTY
jgi:hypothetical protein